MIQREEIHGALARGYCTPENAHKEVDVALVSAMADEIFALMADHKAIVKELVEALEASRKAINTLDEDALGMVTREDGHGGINYWPFKVELLHQIDTAIAKARGVS